MIDELAAFPTALAAHAAHLSATLRETAWVLRQEAFGVPLRCADARVTSVRTDAHGQAARFGVATSAACLLVVSTNYVSTLRATARVGEAWQSAMIVPVDLALTGIVVPAGASEVTLAPRVEIPWWSRLAAMLGGVLLVLAILATRSRQPEVT